MCRTQLSRFLITTVFCLPLVLFCQAPQKFKYQSVARDVSGKLIIDTKIALRISIRDLGK